MHRTGTRGCRRASAALVRGPLVGTGGSVVRRSAFLKAPVRIEGRRDSRSRRGRRGDAARTDLGPGTERSKEVLDRRPREPTSQVDRQRVLSLPMPPAYLDVRAKVPHCPQPQGEGPGAAQRGPGVAVESSKKMAERLGRPFRRAPGEGKPTARLCLPVIDPDEPDRTESVQDARGEPEQVPSLDDLPLAQELLDTAHDPSGGSRQLRTQVDFEVNVREQAWTATSSGRGTGDRPIQNGDRTCQVGRGHAQGLGPPGAHDCRRRAPGA